MLFFSTESRKWSSLFESAVDILSNWLDIVWWEKRGLVKLLDYMSGGHPTSRMRLHWWLHLMKGGQPFFPVQTKASGAIPLFVITAVGGRTREAVLPL
jgi:hypothetical protein